MLSIEIQHADEIVAGMRKDAEGYFRGAAVGIYDAITTIRGTGYGAPRASGRYAASVMMALNRVDPSTISKQNYKYPKPSQHQYEVGNLPAPTVGEYRDQREAAIAPFKLGDSIVISNSLDYADDIESEAHSWQIGGRGVFSPSVEWALNRITAR